MISLDVATDRLLHRKSYRAAFLEGRTDDLDLSADDLRALQFLDRDLLVETAEAVRASLLERKHRGSGGIRAAYPGTLAVWQAEHSDDDLEIFLDRFMESEAFDLYREVPHAGAGLSLEEGLFRFFEAEDVGEPERREREFLTAICKALALNPRPSFLTGPPLRRAPAGWFAVSRRGPPSLFAAVSGQFIHGELTPFLADVLTSGHPLAQLASFHKVTGPVAAAAVSKFTALGLLPGEGPTR